MGEHRSEAGDEQGRGHLEGGSTSPRVGCSGWGVEENQHRTWVRPRSTTGKPPWRNVPRGAGVGTSCARDVTKAVFLEDEPGVDVPNGDILNFLKFPIDFSLFWAISPCLVMRMPAVPCQPREHLLFCLSWRESPLLGSHCRSFPPPHPHPPLYPVYHFIFIPTPF